MLRLLIALALGARISVATIAPGTGYSDADSCPPPEKTPFGAVVTHSCSFCATTLTRAPLIRKDAAWQSVAFANHATDAARLVEVDAAGRELPRGTVAPGAEKTFRCQVGTTWRARRLETNEILLEHRVGAVRLVAEPPEDVLSRVKAAAQTPIAHRKTQNDPHNLRRLRRPTGPQRAALR